MSFQYQTRSRAGKPCPIAEGFQQTVRDRILFPLSEVQRTAGKPSRQQVAMGKYLLQEEYWVAKRRIGAGHQGMMGGKHVCVQDVYEQTYERLHTMDVQLRPPVDLILEYEQILKRQAEQQQAPAAPQQPPIHKIEGIFFGEEERE